VMYLTNEMRAPLGADTAFAARELTQSLDEFEGIIARFDSIHDDLIRTNTQPSGFIATYFDDSAGFSLAERVKSFVNTARNVLADPDNPATMARLRAIEQSNLLLDLDVVVQRLEEESTQTVTQLLLLENASLAFAALVIAMEIAFVFAPGHKLLQTIYADLTTRNTALEEAKVTLAAHNQELEDRNLIIQNEQERVAAALNESEALRREQAEFTYSVSHDLKSPGNTLLLLLNEMETDHRDSLNADARDLLDMSLKTVHRMNDVIEDTLEYFWILDSPDPPEQISLQAQVDMVCKTLAPAIAQSGARISYNGLDSVLAYAPQIKALLLHMIGNAIKFQPEGQTPVVEITSLSDASTGKVTLRISDNGLGIAPENHDRVFGMFKRLHLRESYPGTGLGLTTCKRIADNHSGRIRVESQLGSGTTFCVTFGAPIRHTPSPEMEHAA